MQRLPPRPGRAASGDGDDFDAGLAQQRVRVDVAVVADDNARLQCHQVVPVVPLLPLRAEDVATCGHDLEVDVEAASSVSTNGFSSRRMLSPEDVASSGRMENETIMSVTRVKAVTFSGRQNVNTVSRCIAARFRGRLATMIRSAARRQTARSPPG